MFSLEDIFNDIKNGASLERLHKKYGGLRLYITNQRPNYKECIKEEFTGYNYDALAYKYNVSTSTVREVLKEDKEDEPSLFG